MERIVIIIMACLLGFGLMAYMELYKKKEEVERVRDSHYQKFWDQRQDYRKFIDKMLTMYPELKIKEYDFSTGVFYALPIPENYEELVKDWKEKMADMDRRRL